MTQVLEEAPFAQQANQALGLAAPVQFLLRYGYVNSHPEPVAERRPVDWFVQNGENDGDMA